jgi:hypothetical protein
MSFFLDVIASEVRRIEFYRLGLHFRTHMECLIVVLPCAHRLASLDGTLTMAAQAGLRALHERDAHAKTQGGKRDAPLATSLPHHKSPTTRTINLPHHSP